MDKQIIKPITYIGYHYQCRTYCMPYGASVCPAWEPLELISRIKWHERSLSGLANLLHILKSKFPYNFQCHPCSYASALPCLSLVHCDLAIFPRCHNSSWTTD